MEKGSPRETPRDRLLHTLCVFREVPDETNMVVPLGHVAFTLPGVQVEESRLTLADLRELWHALNGDDEWVDEHDWRPGSGGEGLQCVQCELLHRNWSGRGCPGSPEFLTGSVYW